MEPDFKGWVTKYGVKCSDGRTIEAGSFAHQTGAQVPLVWQHGHDTPTNILGHVKLEDRPEGTWGEAFFNTSANAAHTKEAVAHKDLDSMSIYANKLVERGKVVSHGVIREVSLVLAGANPEAKIEHVSIRHADGDIEELHDEAIIKVGSELEVEGEAVSHASVSELVQGIEGMTETQRQAVYRLMETASYVKSLSGMGDGERQAILDLLHKDDGDAVEHAVSDKTVQQVLDTLDEEQAAAVAYVVKQFQDGNVKHTEGDNVNVFEKQAREKAGDSGNTGPQTLSHDAMKEIMADASKLGSFKKATEDYALKHGIENIESLFPDPKDLTNAPQWITRRVEWVGTVMNGVTKTPFSRIRTVFADLTYDAARAKGYIKGTLKKEEFFGMFRRTTEPTTIYKKQSLDRDDIIDITSYDVVAWLKGEMRFMLSEEIARAILVGDGREVDDEDKVDATKIRPIAYEQELYAASVPTTLNPGDAATIALVDKIVSTRPLYKGSGSPTFFTTTALLTRMLLVRDADGHRLYKSVAELASDMRVSNIVEVEIVENHTDLLGILVNLTDYRVGTDRGGEVTLFDDFDIDYNKYKYLAETRFSGALTVPRSAIVYRNAGTDTAATPVKPAYVAATKTVTIPTTTGVDYLIDGVVKAPGAYVLDADTRVVAQAKAGYYLPVPAEYKYSPNLT